MSPVAAPPPEEPTAARRVRRRRVRPVRILGGVLIAAAVLLLLGVALTRTALCKVWLLPVIGNAMGVRVEAAHARILPGGTVVLEDAAFYLPGVEGPAARFMSASGLEVDLDFSRPGVPISRVRLDGVVLRVSQAVDADEVNLQAWPIPRGGVARSSGPRRTAPPRIDLRSALIEVGEHQGEQYRVLKRINVRGAVVPVEGQDAWAIDLHEADPGVPSHALEGGLAVAGRIDEAGVHLKMTRASLRDWPAAAVPTRYRDVFALLRLEGEITQTFLELPWDGDAEAGIVLSNVSMTLPFEARQHASEEGEDRERVGDEQAAPMRMTRTGGTIRFVGGEVSADLDGWLEDLPYSVRLDYHGLSADSPFHCEMSTREYQLSERPRLLPFLPDEVMQRLADFQNPTGLVNASLVIERAAPDRGAAAAASFSGVIHVHDGRAAFHVFPYPFEQMEAQVSFDEHEVRIDRITGVSASGARLVASGLVTPLNNKSEVTIRVAVTGVPVDDLLRSSMGADREELLDAVFNRARLRELEDAGLVISTQTQESLRGERDAGTRRLADLSRVAGPAARQEARAIRQRQLEIERQLRLPVFDLGGRADVNVVVHRAYGPDSLWESLVEVDLPRAGILPAHFPLPVEASDVRLTIRDRDLSLTRGRFHPITGGSAEVRLAALMPGDDPQREPFKPEVTIRATGLPYDAFLAHAITRAGEPTPSLNSTDVEQGAQDSDRVGRLAWGRGLCESSLSGLVDAEAHVLCREGAHIGFDAVATFQRTSTGTPMKPGDPAQIVLTTTGGTLTASEREIRLAFDAQAQTQSEALSDTVSPAGRLSVDAWLALTDEGDHPSGSYRVAVSGQDVVSQAPVERLVGLITPEVEGTLADLRARYQPTGTITGSVLVEGVLGSAQPRIGLGIESLDDAQVTLAAGRVGVSNVSGSLNVTLATADAPGLLQASSFAGDVSLDGAPEMRLRLDGEAELLAARPGAGEAATSDAPQGDVTPETAPPTTEAGGPESLALAAPATGRLDVRIGMEGARFESALTRGAIEAFAPGRGAAILPLDPAGTFDARLSIVRQSKDAEAVFDGEILPRSLAVSMWGERIEFPSVEGGVRFDAHGGQAEQIRASNADASLTADASWTRTPDGQVVLDATIAGDAGALTPGVRSLLPTGVRAALDQIAVRADGPVSLDEGVLHVAWPAEGDPSVRASGLVRVSGASANVGVPIEQAAGWVRFQAESTPGAPARYSLAIAGDSLRAGGMLLTDARARVQSGEREGEVLVPLLQGEAYGGRVAGTGRMTLGGRARPTLQYDMTLQASGVRFASLLEDRGGGGASFAASSSAVRGDPAPPAPDGPADASRGLLAAEVSLGGVVGDDSSRRGRGSLQVGGGTVVSLPLLLPIIEVTNLRLPASTPLDVAFAEFYVLGDRVTFEDLSAFTRTVEIWGYGTLDWDSQHLDMRFNTRSTAPIPVVSELLEGVRNEIISTRVRGTLEDPDVGTIQFAGTRSVIDTLLGDGPSEQQRRLAEIGDRARLNRSRALRAGERLRWLVASQMEGHAPAQGP